jgi:hypothetical protein
MFMITGKLNLYGNIYHQYSYKDNNLHLYFMVSWFLEKLLSKVYVWKWSRPLSYTIKNSFEGRDTLSSDLDII